MSDETLNAISVMGGLLMSSYGRSKKPGQSFASAAMVDMAVLHYGDKIRKAYDAGLDVVLLVERVKGDGCICPHCQCAIEAPLPVKTVEGVDTLGGKL
jgi:hypothetical protein